MYYEKSPKTEKAKILLEITTIIASLLRPTTPGSPVSQNTKSTVVVVLLHLPVESPELDLHAGLMIHTPIPTQKGIENKSQTPLLLRKRKPLSRDTTTK